MGATDQPPKTQVSMAETADIIYFFSIFVSHCFYALLHIGMGTHAIGLRGVGAFLYMLCFAEMTHCGYVYLYLMAWCLGVIVQQFLKNKEVHSEYIGYPLCCRLPFVRTERGGRVAEALLVGGMGFACASLDPNLTMFLWSGSACLLAKEAIEVDARKRRLRVMKDNGILQRQMMEEFRR